MLTKVNHVAASPARSVLSEPTMTSIVLILADTPEGVVVTRVGDGGGYGDGITLALALEQYAAALAARPGLLADVTPAQTQAAASAAAERLASPVRAVT